MDFFKLLILHDYLYSPKNRLHRQNKVFKILIIFAYLSFLPYLPFSNLFIFMTLYLILYEFCNLPIKFVSDIFKISFILSLFSLLSIQKKTQILKQENCNRDYLLLFNKVYNAPGDTFYSFYFFYGFPFSLLRLSIIYFLYLMTMKLLTLTTSQKDILNCFFLLFKKYNLWFMPQFIFELQLSLNFLKIILKQTEIIQLAYSTRSISYVKFWHYKDSWIILFFNLQQLISNIYSYTYHVSNTLYNNEIKLSNLKINK